MTSRRVISRESRQCSQVRPFLYVGGLAALSPRVLSRFCTTINLIPGFRISAPNHMKVVHIPLTDDESTELSPYWTTVFKEIDDTRKSAGRLLLLCAMGISRSATFAIAYLMCIEKLSLHDAYKHVQQCRNIICPNIGFFQQMIDLEQKLRGCVTVQIIEPIAGIKVADVVWTELYQEMMDTMSEADRHSLRSLNIGKDSARIEMGDTRSLRSLNIIDEAKVDDTSSSQFPHKRAISTFFHLRQQTVHCEVPQTGSDVIYGGLLNIHISLAAEASTF
uniref:Tyrosine-protein phosphatase domain-containing protein n=1 Tax=Heterorhabditis bacteriophora TaxID=37862 RepID=A0A1I7XSC4_HETBA